VSPRDALAALAGGVGLVAGVVGVAIAVAVTLVALGVPEEGRADDAPPLPVIERPTRLVVGLTLVDPVLQAGVVTGRQVVLARGLEVELVRRLATRLRIPEVRFVTARPGAIVAGTGEAPWHLALGGLTLSRLLSSGGGLSTSYLPSGHVVVIRPHGSRPRTLADLGRLHLCALARTPGAALARRLSHTSRPEIAPGPARLRELVRTGACDAALVGMTRLHAVFEGHPLASTRIVARIDDSGGYALAIASATGLDRAEIDRAVLRLRRDGALGTLSRFWLGFDPLALPALR
jgi:ABC-type amino acid transport substrate-binding protein